MIYMGVEDIIYVPAAYMRYRGLKTKLYWSRSKYILDLYLKRKLQDKKYILECVYTGRFDISFEEIFSCEVIVVTDSRKNQYVMTRENYTNIRKDGILLIEENYIWSKLIRLVTLYIPMMKTIEYQKIILHLYAWYTKAIGNRKLEYSDDIPIDPFMLGASQLNRIYRYMIQKGG